MCENNLLTELDYGKGISKECLNMWREVEKIRMMMAEAMGVQYFRKVMEEDKK